MQPSIQDLVLQRTVRWETVGLTLLISAIPELEPLALEVPVDIGSCDFVQSLKSHVSSIRILAVTLIDLQTTNESNMCNIQFDDEFTIRDAKSE